jgi:molecular chaperone DnaK
MEKLNNIWQQASQDMYKDAGGQTPPADSGAGDAGSGGSAGGDDGEVTDVDFEEVDDKK